MFMNLKYVLISLNTLMIVAGVLVALVQPSYAAENSSLKVMSLNAQNYFNGRLYRGTVSFKGGRGPSNQRAYAQKKSKLVDYIQHVNPDILALQEVENDTRYPSPAILDLKSSLGNDYELVSFGSISKSTYTVKSPYGDDAITQFILYKPSNKLKAIGHAKSFSWSGNGAGRPIILQKFSMDQNRTFCVANSHLKSKRNSCGQDQQCTQKRLKQAKVFSKSLKQQRDYCGSILWVGDFNSEPHQQTMRYLKSSQWQLLLAPQTYSYIFRGRKILLDHALWHSSNALFDINAFVDHTPKLLSDHFPVIIEIR